MAAVYQGYSKIEISKALYKNNKNPLLITTMMSQPKEVEKVVSFTKGGGQAWQGCDKRSRNITRAWNKD